MKGRFLDAVIAAGREHRSVALATGLKGGQQLLLDGDRTEGELALDDAAIAAMREALRADRNRTLDTGSLFFESQDWWRVLDSGVGKRADDVVGMQA